MALLRLFLCLAPIISTATSSECKDEAVVGHCFIKGCFMGHGAFVHCSRFQCVCNQGYCAVGDICVPSNTSAPITVTTTTTTDMFAPYGREPGECGSRAMEIRRFIDHGVFANVTAKYIGNQCNMKVDDKDDVDDLIDRECCLLRYVKLMYKQTLPDCWDKIGHLFRTEQGHECNETADDEMELAALFTEDFHSRPPVLALASACLLVGLAIRGIMIYRDSRRIDQAPLLA